MESFHLSCRVHWVHIVTCDMMVTIFQALLNITS